MSGEWRRSTARLLRHRRPKGPGTDRPSLNHRVTPRLYSNLGGTLQPTKGDGVPPDPHLGSPGLSFGSPGAPRPRLLLMASRNSAGALRSSSSALNFSHS